MYEIKVTVFKRGRRYYMQFRDELGKTVQKSTGKTILRDAERVAGEWERKLREGNDWQAGRISWKCFRDRFETEHLSGLADTTEAKYLACLNVFESMVNPKRLRDINEKRLSLFRVRLRETGREESTIKSHMTHIKAAMNWAKDQKLIDRVPKFPAIQRARKSSGRIVMKGRPITLEEFERMLNAVEKVIVEPNKGKAKARKDRAPDRARIPSWQQFLRGLWVSGLRLSEAMDLHWTDEEKIRPDGKFFRVPCEAEKGHEDRILPMAPECYEFLQTIPRHRRRGFVFNPIGQNKGADRLTVQTVGRRLVEIGEAAQVKVDTRNGKPVYASAHDLRRSFGERWAALIMPKQLMELMRHKSIETTMRYYVGSNAKKTSAILWEAHRKAATMDCQKPDGAVLNH